MMSPESDLARAILGRVVLDLAEPEVQRPIGRPRLDGTGMVVNRLAGDARAWLYAEDDAELNKWRDELATLADVDLEGLRKVCDDAPPARLRQIARLLDKGGSW